MNKRFAVVDIETTGALVRRDRITEIGIVITDGEQILDTWTSLVNPGISIPPFITKITGITNEMVADAPPFYEVAKKVVEMTENCIFVAHNVRFDYGFLRAMFEELGYAYNKQRLCTVQLAKRTLDMQKFSLGTLIRHFDIQVENRHRALDDAYATAIVLQKLLQKDKLHENLNHQIKRGVRESLLPESISIDDLYALPEESGVYYFLDSTHDIVYVGKSKNIQKRVMSHFTKTTSKATQLQNRVRHLDFRLTGNDLLAQIVEAQEIRRHKPEINRAQRSSSFQFFLVQSKNSLGYIRFAITTRPKSSETILNAFPTKKSALSTLNFLIGEYGLCPLYMSLEKGMGPCSLFGYQKCAGACIHQEDPEDYNERAVMAIDRANNRFDRDFVIVDRGRKRDEKSVILVNNGQYVGHGYVENDISVSHPAQWMDVVQNAPYYPEINSMIRRYVDQGGGEHIYFLELPAEV